MWVLAVAGQARDIPGLNLSSPQPSMRAAAEGRKSTRTPFMLFITGKGPAVPSRTHHVEQVDEVLGAQPRADGRKAAQLHKEDGRALEGGGEAHVQPPAQLHRRDDACREEGGGGALEGPQLHVTSPPSLARG